MNTIRLLDISGLFWPVWRKKEAMGRPIGEAAAETVQALRERAAANAADYVVACCDAGRSFRWEIAEEYRAMLPDYPGYKSHRPVKDPAMMAALSRVIEELRADGVPIMQVPGFEADDCIATLTCWAVEHGHDVEIVSDDKDLRQLIVDPDPDNEHSCSVRVVERDGTVHNEASVLAQFGVPPQRLGAWLALAGDTSDGIKGVPDIGEKTASALLYGRYDDEKKWHPTPFMSFKQAVEAAQADQETVDEQERTLADIREGREVRKLAKQGMGDEQIAAQLRVTADIVARHRATVGPDKLPTFPKPRFKESTRKALLGGSQWFDISYRLTLLRRDVPLDFAQVTAPRVPTARPGKTEWKAPEEAPQQPTTVYVVSEEEEPMAIDSHQDSATTTAPIPEVTGEHVEQTAPQIVTPQRAIMRVSADEFRLALEPQDYMTARMVADDMFESGLFAVQRAQAALALIQVGRQHGLSAVQSLMEIHMIDNKPCLSAKIMVALVRRSKKARYFKLVEASPTGAKWKTLRVDDPDSEPMYCSFTIEDAKRALLGGISEKKGNEVIIKDNFKADSQYAKYPEDMCVWRAAARLCRREYSDVIGGLYAIEEMDENAPTTPFAEAA